MNEYVGYFLKDGCELMPDGDTRIFDYLENPDGTVTEVLLGTGPQNYLTYTVDCYQLYLWYVNWDKKPLRGSLSFPEFVIEIVKEPKIKIVKNWRYEALGKPPPLEVRPFLGKMFLGVRFKDKLWLAEEKLRS